MNVARLGSHLCGYRPKAAVLLDTLRQQCKAGYTLDGAFRQRHQLRLYGFGSHMNDNDPVHGPSTFAYA